MRDTYGWRHPSVAQYMNGMCDIPENLRSGNLLETRVVSDPGHNERILAWSLLCCQRLRFPRVAKDSFRLTPTVTVTVGFCPR